MKQNLGEFIAALRKEKGLTQRELAELLNVSDKTISHWEREESSPDISVLPFLAEIFNITVDELLKGERKEQFFSSPSLTLLPSPVDKTVSHFRNFKILNIIAAAISIISVVLGVGIKYLMAYFTYTEAANGFAFFVTLGGVFVSVVSTVIFNIIFRNKLNPDAEGFCKYRFTANRISSLNTYLELFCLSLIPCFMRKHGFIFTVIALTLMLITELILGKTGVLSTEKAFENKLSESIYFLRKSCAMLCTMLIIFGGGVHYMFSALYHPTPEPIVFTSAQEFKTYMETPQEKPNDAYLIDGVSATALHTTALSPIVGSETETHTRQSLTDPLPEEAETETESVYNDLGEEILVFYNRNKAVISYVYNGEENTFHVITYNEIIRVQKLRTFCRTTLGRLMPLYYLSAAGLTLIVYKKKAVKIKK